MIKKLRKKLLLIFIIFMFISASVYCLTRIGGFLVNDIDETSNIVEYYGFNTSYNDEWYILELTSFTARYLRGAGNYDAFWSSRTINNYFPFSEINHNVQ